MSQTVADQPKPHNSELERAVLGACLLGDLSVIEDVNARLQPESFHHTAHRKIFAAILAVSKSGAVDALSVTEQLRQDGALDAVGGGPALSSLAGEMVTAAYAVQHAELVRDLFLRRQVINRATQVLQSAYDETVDTDEVVARAATISDGFDDASDDAWEPVEVGAKLAMDHAEYVWQHPGESAGIKTNLTVLDSYTDGWQDDNLVIVAGRPSMGKTTFGIWCALQAAQHGPGAFVSAEMAKRLINHSFLATLAGVEKIQLRNGNFSPDEYARLQSAEKELKQLPIFVSDELKEPRAIASHVRQLQRKEGIGWLVVDYLQILKPPAGERHQNREREIAAISGAMKELAMKCGMPVLLLSQLSRANESRPDRRPQLSDLRDSGSIEQDADLVLFLHRPEYYFRDDEEEKGKCEIILAKQRMGPTGVIDTRIDLKTGGFSDWDY